MKSLGDNSEESMYRADPRVRIGHVHLKVANIDRALVFYHEVLGLDIVSRIGETAAFLSAGGYHHHIAINTWESLDGSPPPSSATGLFHVAFLYPDRRSLADVLLRLRASGIALEGAADHGVSEALYLRDPDGNGVELYRDRPATEWEKEDDGSIRMFTHPLNLAKLLSEASDTQI